MALQLEKIEERKWENTTHSILLIGLMILFLSSMGLIIGGITGLILLGVFSALLFLFMPRVPPRLIMRMHGARRIDVWEQPELLRILGVLAGRAQLPAVPALFYIPSHTKNAFAVGTQSEPIIGVTDGLLRRFSSRELAGVLAHEVSHLRHNDTFVMGLAELVSRLTVTLANVGIFLFLINIPLILMGGKAVPWLLVLFLNFAPIINALLQRALSRTREYQADTEAANLTGDPRGLASALYKLERLQYGFLGSILHPGRKANGSSLLRTHPSTEDRIARLLELERREPRVWWNRGGDGGYFARVMSVV